MLITFLIQSVQQSSPWLLEPTSHNRRTLLNHSISYYGFVSLKEIAVLDSYTGPKSRPTLVALNITIKCNVIPKIKSIEKCRNVLVTIHYQQFTTLICTFILCYSFFFLYIIYFPGTREFPGNWCSGTGIPGKNISGTYPIPKRHISDHLVHIFGTFSRSPTSPSLFPPPHRIFYLPTK